VPPPVLDHPHIVHALDAEQTERGLCLVMEYVEGNRPCKRLVKQRGPLPVAEAATYVRQAALGLQHAFEKGLVHRDVKPSNLLLTSGGLVKILDFGLAHQEETAGGAATTLTQEGQLPGHAGLRGARANHGCTRRRYSRGFVFIGLHLLLPVDGRSAFSAPQPHV